MDKTGSMLKMIRMFYAYNSWATSQLINSLDKLSAEELTAPGCSGHGSIRHTLAHFLGTQLGWFSWFDKSLTAQESITLRVSPDEIDTPEKLKQKWQSIDEQTHNCLDQLTEVGVNDIWFASFPNGFSMALALWQLLLHVANHGTHTRAQIVAAVRRFGFEPGIYEFFRFALSQS